MPLLQLASTSSWRRWLWMRPEAWAVLACVAGWTVLAASWLQGAGHATHASAPWPTASDPVHGIVMAIAMMTPLVLAQLRHAAQSSLWSRRNRATALVWSAYIVVWTLVAIALAVVARGPGRTFGLGLDPVGGIDRGRCRAAVAASKATARACTYTCPLPPRGPRLTPPVSSTARGLPGSASSRAGRRCSSPLQREVWAAMAVIAGLGVVERSATRRAVGTRGAGSSSRSSSCWLLSSWHSQGVRTA